MTGDYHSGDLTTTGERVDAPPMAYSPPTPSKSSTKGYGCWIAGCLGSLLAGVLLIAAVGFGGYWWFTQQVEKYTAAEPSQMPVVEMEEEEVTALREEVESFFKQVVPENSESTIDLADGTDGVDGADDGDGNGAENQKDSDDGIANRNDQPVLTELVLSAEQINALLQSFDSDFGQAFVEISDGAVNAKISIPTDNFPGGAGRHFNADADIEVSLEDGILLIQIVAAKVKGEPLPEEFITELSKQNLAKEMYEDAETAKILRRFESIEVIDDTVRMRLKQPAKATKTSEPNSVTQSTNETTSETNGEVFAEEELPLGTN